MDCVTSPASRNRRLTHIEPTQVGLRHPAGGKGFLALMAREGKGTPHMDAARHGALAAFAGAGADQLALKFAPTRCKLAIFYRQYHVGI